MSLNHREQYDFGRYHSRVNPSSRGLLSSDQGSIEGQYNDSCGPNWYQQSNFNSLSLPSSCSMNDPLTMGNNIQHVKGRLNHHPLSSPSLSASPSAFMPTSLRRDLPPSADHDPYVMSPLPPLSSFSLGSLSLPCGIEDSEDSHHRSSVFSSMGIDFPVKLGEGLDLDSSISDDDDDENQDDDDDDEGISCLITDRQRRASTSRPYPPPLRIPLSPESPESVDTDLDDESLLSASSSTLSPPPFQDDAELRDRFMGDDEEGEDEDEELDDLFSNVSTSPTLSSISTLITPTIKDDNGSDLQHQLYHHIDKYPSSHLYDFTSAAKHTASVDSPLQSSCPLPSVLPSPLSPGKTHSIPPTPLPPSFTSPSDPPPLRRQLQLPTQSNNDSSFDPPFYDLYDDRNLSIPCSPSRRRSKELPTLENDIDSLGLEQFDKGSFSGSSSISMSPSLQQQERNHRHLQDQSQDCQPKQQQQHQPPHQPQQRTNLLSLPGSDTDDELIPMDLASKNYVPDASIVVPTSSSYASGDRSLLMWEPLPVFELANTSSSMLSASCSDSKSSSSSSSSSRLPLPNIRFGSLLTRESSGLHHPPTPDELFDPELDNILLTSISNPSLLAEIAPQGAQDELVRLCELRRRNWWHRERDRENSHRERCRGDRESGWKRDRDGRGERERESGWEKEKWRELSTLLRLKLRLDERGSKNEKDSAVDESRTHSISEQQQQQEPLRASSLPTTMSLSSSSSSSSRRYFKPRVTSMDQLVANMVFHRQQQSSEAHPSGSSRGRNGYGVPNSGGCLDPSTLSSTGPCTSPSSCSMSAQTPRSPLRQVTLPVDLENDSETEDDGKEKNEAVKEEETLTMTLSPLMFTMSPLSYATEI